MVITQILGGFGNQLSAYAWGYSLAKHLDQELVLDISDYTNKGYFRPYALDKLRIGSCRKLVYPPQSGGFIDAEGIPGSLRDCGLRIINSDEVKTREVLLKSVEGAKDVYLMGYGGMHFCTLEDQAEIRAQYQFKEPSGLLEQFRERISQEYSVAVHIRRTDFVALGLQASAEYFQAAITYIKIFQPRAHFYFFSDDSEYAKEQFGLAANYHYVHIPGGMDADLEEFFCISACNSRILSKQSTFSSWASELNQKENKLDICQADADGSGSGRTTIYLNQSAIETLSRQYRVEQPSLNRNMADVNDLVFNLVSEGCSEKAVRTIDAACLDISELSKGKLRELTTLKGIALAQQGEKGQRAALRLFYEQMQRENEDPVFHANYFRVLYHSGHILESAIHAALANRFGDTDDYLEFFQEGQIEPFALRLYQFLRDSCPRHFIFIPMEGWSYYITYVKTLAVLLARMGQKVTFVRASDIRLPAGEIRDADLAGEAWKRAVPADSTYQYHIDLLSYPRGYVGEKAASLFKEIIRQCTHQSVFPTVVVASHPHVFAAEKVAGVKYIVPDICDPLNREKFYLENDVSEYLFYMTGYADAVFVSGSVQEALMQHYAGRIHRAYSSGVGGYQILDMETDFTSNYISHDQMIRNAAALLDDSFLNE